MLKFLHETKETAEKLSGVAYDHARAVRDAVALCKRKPSDMSKLYLVAEDDTRIGRLVCLLAFYIVVGKKEAHVVNPANVKAVDRLHMLSGVTDELNSLLWADFRNRYGYHQAGDKWWERLNYQMQEDGRCALYVGDE